jgi:hypothetical protein
MPAPLVVLPALTFVTESGASFDAAQPPPSDWLVLQEGRPLGPRRFAAAVGDEQMRTYFRRADGPLVGTVATFTALGLVPAVQAAASPAPRPHEELLVPAGLAWSAGWLGLGLLFAELTGGKREVRSFYALEEAQARATGD